MTRPRLFILAFAACLLGAALASPAQAQYRHGARSHAHFGLRIGIPIGWPYWGWGYPYPYYYQPYPSQVVVAPSGPTTYVEQPRAESAPEASGYWYYCAGAGAYYPYVRECLGGWQRVAPRPPGE